MKFAREIALVLVFAALALGGCEPPGGSPLAEQNNPHYKQGMSRRLNGDNKGAIELFEQAIETDPHNASAHLELGLLYEKPENDFAAAVYHFQKHLQLRPKSEQADIINAHILACKQELARTVLPTSLPQTAERELMNLTRKNEDLSHKNEEVLRELASVRSQYLAMVLALTNQTSRTGSIIGGSRGITGSPQPVQQSIQPAGAGRRSNTGGSFEETRPAGNQAAARSHVVAPGETFTSISRRYGISLEQLRAANPGVGDRSLQIGQKLTVPAR